MPVVDPTLLPQSNDREPSQIAGAERAPTTVGPPARAHLPALDGVRGLASLLVVFYHTVGLLPISGGVDGFAARLGQSSWVGVDLFFVLSGFLITGVLLDSRGRVGYYRNFVVRRALRIVPVYALFLVLVLFILPFLGILPPDRNAEARANALWFLTFTSNFALAKFGSGATGDLTHLWSIAVEEQFYLIWPWIVLLVAPSRLRWLALALLVIAPLIRLIAASTGASPFAIYVMSPTRYDGMIVGAFIAAAIRMDTNRVRLRAAVSVAGALSVAVLCVLFLKQGTVNMFYRSTSLVGFSALAIVGGFVVLHAAQLGLTGQRSLILDSWLLRSAGKYSYSLYVFHQLVMQLLDRAGLSWKTLPTFYGSALPAALFMFGVVTAATLVVSVFTWRYIERPALALKRHFPD